MTTIAAFKNLFSKTTPRLPSRTIFEERPTSEVEPEWEVHPPESASGKKLKNSSQTMEARNGTMHGLKKKFFAKARRLKRKLEACIARPAEEPRVAERALSVLKKDREEEEPWGAAKPQGNGAMPSEDHNEWPEDLSPVREVHETKSKKVRKETRTVTQPVIQ